MEPQPAAGGPLGQRRQRVDTAEIGGAGGGHQGNWDLPGGFHPVEGAVQLVGAQAATVVHAERLDGPAAQPQQGRGPGDAEVGKPEQRTRQRLASGPSPSAAARPRLPGRRRRRGPVPHQVDRAARGHHLAGAGVPATRGQLGHQPLQAGGHGGLVPGVERLVGGGGQGVGGHGGGQRLAVEVGGAGRMARVDAVAEAEAPQPGQGRVQPGALLGERLDPGHDLASAAPGLAPP